MARNQLSQSQNDLQHIDKVGQTQRKKNRPTKEDFIEELKKYDYIRLTFPDLNGIHLSKLLSTRFADKIAENQSEMYSGIIAFGPRFELIDIPEIVNRKHVNNRLCPDYSTLHPCLWTSAISSENTQKEPSICAVICDMAWPDGKLMNTHPRVVAQNLLKELETKHGLHLYSAFEPEFCAFKKGTLEPSCLNPNETNPNLAQQIQPPTPFTSAKEMYRTGLLAVYEKFFMDVDRCMHAAGIHLQDFSNENGQAQLEAPLLPEWGIMSADHYFIFKQAVKEIAPKHDMEVSFMTKPLLYGISSGCHFNHSLWNKDQTINMFHDKKDPDNLSTLARHWIGGLIAHLPAMLALCSPTVNCYRRLHKDLAPDAINWDFNDRFVTIRVKNFDHTRTYIENRIPSSASCPYHVLAATLAAGIDGIERKLEPPKPGLKPSTTKDVKLLPDTLEEALEILQNDCEFVNKIGPNFVAWFTQVKERGDFRSLKHADIRDQWEHTIARERFEYLQFI